MTEPDLAGQLPPGALLARMLEQRWEQGEQPDPIDFLKASAAGDVPVTLVAAVLAVDQWRRWHNGQRVLVEDYLRRWPALADAPDAAVELIHGEFLVRDEVGDAPAPAEYLSRFPAFADALSEQFAVSAAMTQLTPPEGSPAQRARSGLRTPFSLLERLRQPGERAAWDRFIELYSPLLYHWARHVGLQDGDASDLVQDVLMILVQKMPEFRYDPNKSFRSWLRTVTLNRWRDNRKRRDQQPLHGNAHVLEELASPDSDDGFWEAEYRRQLVAQGLAAIRAEFQAATWQACWEFAVVGKPAGQVAAELNITENAVYLAKGRVMRRLRRELEGLLD
jgi:RNA polymerase sigma-70 factor (ECF subfamily)